LNQIRKPSVRFPAPAARLFAIAITLLSACVAFGQTDEVVGEPWTGESGITETVAKIMERERHSEQVPQQPANSSLTWRGTGQTSRSTQPLPSWPSGHQPQATKPPPTPTRNETRRPSAPTFWVRLSVNPASSRPTPWAT